MKKRLSHDVFREILEHLEKNGRLSQERKYFQHGNTTVYEHSLKVARTSLRLAEKLHLRVNQHSLVKGALLHDYFLYDWHENDSSHRLHGFTHPKTALRNAKQDFGLNSIEENIIKHHMFPLTPTPPTCREAWLVCLADKYCALIETVNRNGKRGI